GSPIIKAIDISNTYNVTTDYLINDQEADAPDRVMAKIYDGLKTLPGAELLSLEDFKNPDGKGVHILSFTKVVPTIADDIRTSAIWSTVVGLIVIFLYILVRFSKWQYSLGATLALAHDVLITVSVFSLFHGWFPISLEIDQTFIAALLTLIGYSINDTVIVFDRIREYMSHYTTLSQREVVNKAINSTLTRTVITSMTVFFTVLVLLIFGGSSIKGFAFAMTVGVLAGTYSSIFMAAPVLVDLERVGNKTDKSVAHKTSAAKPAVKPEAAKQK
ncbi:MAG TPA: protein translocase subunit SecF, partial [Saprospiraceae bacterium]|nr:protein translocase subunit SecF [Saprospiraceae bacterium]